jgi:hypothetical protein
MPTNRTYLGFLFPSANSPKKEELTKARWQWREKPLSHDEDDQNA